MAKKPHAQPCGQIRIIAGQWRGRKLPVPDSPGLRPTTDRVRETLFNWLAPILHDTQCLDAFAGGGALGFEAVSRYAARATLLESDRQVAAGLRKNAALLNCPQIEVIHTDTLRFLAQPGTPYQVVFLDPPFRQGLLNDTLTLLEQNGWLAADAWIYVESEVDGPALPIPASWALQREKVAGQVAYRLYRRQATAQHEGDNHVD
ncbi:16S rRNA (guanine(966)-N(2))-methyltransferase [Edwardsiella piscicida]|uniref:16S rRNA (guanine(966)-N(2))-methyltransferase n=1 Tax=Edwardsiella piscicida TaxID=1263550 RepID=UPI001CF313D2|nr:16S rRNA (guanine(966)-N(2))-methyltransferase [Edwardsiella piscicida]UCQ57440.1 16S rRNA (guanine(966)-N(2))-methyltransferase [Edwardsiella piscicida]